MDPAEDAPDRGDLLEQIEELLALGAECAGFFDGLEVGDGAAADFPRQVGDDRHLLFEDPDDRGEWLGDGVELVEQPGEEAVVADEALHTERDVSDAVEVELRAEIDRLRIEIGDVDRAAVGLREPEPESRGDRAHTEHLGIDLHIEIAADVSRHRRGSDEIGEAGQADPANPDVEAEMGIELTVGDRGRLDRVRRGAIPVDPAVGVVGEAEVEGAEAEFEP